MPERLPIFDDHERTNGAPATHGETSFAFLNRVAGEYWTHPRELLQQWADRLPDDAYADISGRLRKDDAQARSAFLELYLHETLLRSGFTVTIHPDLPDSDRHVDFLAVQGEERFYLEAVMPGGPDTAESNRQSRFLDAVNLLDDDRFFLSLLQLEVGPTAVSARGIRKDLKRWLDTLDPDAVKTSGGWPTFSWSEHGWSAEFGAVPKSVGRRHSSRGQAIGVYAHYEAEFIDNPSVIRRGALSKVRRYGALDAPLVIAVGVYIHDPDLGDTIAAMYGSQVWGLAGAGNPQAMRMTDGFFGSKHDPRHVTTSAVLVVNQLQPYHVHRAQVTVLHHPWTQASRLPAQAFHATEIRLEGARLVRTSASESAGVFFGVDSWADADPWPAVDVEQLSEGGSS
ncbi:MULTISPECIES: hypothetical protein [unclassified Curtobacterium]|uniref:hypothetical protein n=1 Tax=unclassified Curtobacterium TaxID=257496 RepID=UPI001113B5AE|nr:MULTISPECIES: hypothetical protein [unclassified Curtobacterium]